MLSMDALEEASMHSLFFGASRTETTISTPSQAGWGAGANAKPPAALAEGRRWVGREGHAAADERLSPDGSRGARHS